MLTELSLEQLSLVIHSGEVTPLDVIDTFIERIDALNPTLNAFIHVERETARQLARERGNELNKGMSRGPLHGVPLAVKDLIDVAGMPTTGGTILFKDRAVLHSAKVIKNLQDRGAIIVGKTHLQELAIGATNSNPHFGAVRNPWNLEFSPGGSSGGSGAAVAAGMCVGALGTDTSGSVRLPAALCGLTGLRPAIGMVSAQGVLPRSHVLDTVGPLAHTTKGVALLLDAMANLSGKASFFERLELMSTDIQIGLPSSSAFWEGVEPIIVEAVHSAAKVLERRGMKIVDVKMCGVDDAIHAVSVIGVVDALLHYGDLITQPDNGLCAYTRKRLEMALSYEATDYSDAIRIMYEWRQHLKELFTAGLDIILTPTTPIVRHPIGESEVIQSSFALPRFTYPFSLAGLPALSLPGGFSVDNMPIGIQMISASTTSLLQVANEYQQATNWHDRRPQFA